MIENYFGVKNVITKVLHNNPLNRTRQQSMMENEFGVKNVITKLQQKCLKLPREGEKLAIVKSSMNRLGGI